MERVGSISSYFNLLVGLATLSVTTFTIPAIADPVRVTPRVTKLISRSYFGMHIHRADTTTSWPAPRIGAFRLWDANVYWGILEPAKGDWHFERLDKVVDLALAHGVEPMLTLGMTPRWAASRPEELFVYGYGSNSPPRNLQDWEDYVRKVATRYKGRIKYYELWNEPTYDEIDSSKGFYAGSAKTMIELGRIAYRVIKSVDPDNKLVSPPCTDDTGMRLDLFLSLGGKEITDVVAQHFYVQSPERMVPYIATIRAVMTKHGIADKPLWSTEAGYDIPLSGEALQKNAARNDEELGGLIARTLVLGSASGLDRYYWYSWERTMLQRWNKDEVVNPVIVAYTQTMRWLYGTTISQCECTDGRVWKCELNFGRRKSWMVWATGHDSLEWIPPASWHAQQYETLDAKLIKLDQVEPIAIRIGPSPVLIKADSQFWSAYAPKSTAETP